MRVAAVFLSIAAIIELAAASCDSLKRDVCVEKLDKTYGTALSCPQWHMAKDNYARCFVDYECCEEWPAAMARIKNNNQVLALCEMGDCSSCALEKSGTCLEALGLNDATVCSEIEAVKMDGTLQKCFVQNNCCGTWDEFVSTWKAETGLPDCNLGSCAIPPGAVSEVSLDSAAGHNAASLLLSGFFALVLGLHASNRR